jgi:holo-[acyl-carrier protein] synthase
MILGIGIDIIEINRIKESISKFGEQFLNKIYTDKEIEYCSNKANSAQHFAARFAAKEAISKALSTGWNNEFHWKEIEISNLPSGAPVVDLTGRMSQFLTQNKMLKITMSHSDNYVTCFAIYFINVINKQT